MKLLVILPRFQYAIKSRGETHEYSELFSCLKRMYPCAEFLDTSDHIASAEIYSLNLEILRKHQISKFTHIFTVQWGNELFPETIFALRDTGAKVVNWATDDSYRFKSFSSYIADRFDMMVTTQGGLEAAYKEVGGRPFEGHWGFNETWNFPVQEHHACKYDVSFIGINYFDREEYIEYLRAAGIKVFVAGYGWHAAKVIESNEIPRIYNASKVVLNFSKSKNGNQTKARIFEALAAGTCLVTERSDDLEKYFVCGEHLLCFTSKEECLLEVRKILDNSQLRNKLAKSSYEKCISNFSYKTLMTRLFDSLGGPSDIDTTNLDKTIVVLQKNQRRKLYRILRRGLFSPWVPARFRRLVSKIESYAIPKIHLSKNSLALR